uniref:Putative secreted protein n=1 Tax=Panstrongylus lignarius TaxID=156445 RepID=A0A224Y1M0_9HEMI
MSAFVLLILAALVVGTISAPSEQPEEVEQVLYDQRQNGTDNLRLMMNDITLLVAPSEALFSLAPSDIFDGEVKPKVSRPRNRLTSLLMNVFRRNHVE